MAKPLPTIEQYEAFLLARALHVEQAAKDAPWGDPDAARGHMWAALCESSRMNDAFYAIFGAFPGDIAADVYAQDGE